MRKVLIEKVGSTTRVTAWDTKIPDKKVIKSYNQGANTLIENDVLIIEDSNDIFPKQRILFSELDENYETTDIESFGVYLNENGFFLISGGAWGDITGTLSDQTDLQSALNLKLDKVSTSGVERAYTINPDGSQATKPTSDFKDVVEGYFNGTNFYTDAGFTILITGETGKIYIALDTNKTYRWSGSAYVQISAGIEFPSDGKVYGVKDGLPVEIKSQVFTINLGRFLATPTGAGVYTKQTNFAGFYNPTLSTGVSNHLLLSPDSLSVIGKVPFDCSLLDIVLTMSTVSDASFSIWKTAPNSVSGTPIELYHVDDTTNKTFKQFIINSDIILKDSFIHIFYTKRSSTSAYPTSGFLTFNRL